jgi:hypothetical protein
VGWSDPLKVAFVVVAEFNVMVGIGAVLADPINKNNNSKHLTFSSSEDLYTIQLLSSDMMSKEENTIPSSVNTPFICDPSIIIRIPVGQIGRLGKTWKYQHNTYSIYTYR